MRPVGTTISENRHERTGHCLTIRSIRMVRLSRVLVLYSHLFGFFLTLSGKLSPFTGLQRIIVELSWNLHYCGNSARHTLCQGCCVCVFIFFSENLVPPIISIYSIIGITGGASAKSAFLWKWMALHGLPFLLLLFYFSKSTRYPALDLRECNWPRSNGLSIWVPSTRASGARRLQSDAWPGLRVEITRSTPP